MNRQPENDSMRTHVVNKLLLLTCGTSILDTHELCASLVGAAVRPCKITARWKQVFTNKNCYPLEIICNGQTVPVTIVNTLVMVVKKARYQKY